VLLASVTFLAFRSGIWLFSRTLGAAHVSEFKRQAGLAAVVRKLVLCHFCCHDAQ